MKSSTIRFIILGAAISIIGIVSTQVYWVTKAFTLEQRQFDQGVQIALLQVAKRMAKYNESVVPSDNLVKQVSTNYYIVNINDVIDANILEHYLIQEFNHINIVTPFEYAIYDCSSDLMVYGDYISITGDAPEETEIDLQKYDDYTYYFGIRFPERNSFVAAKMDIWIFSTLFLLVVISFFAIAIFIILKQKRLSEVQKDFINNMTHEFKTPISTISIAADVILKHDADLTNDRLMRYGGIIKSEITRLNLQVMRVLQMARIDKDEQNLTYKKINLAELLSDIVNTHRPKVEAKGGQLLIELNCQPIINADEVHLVNIIYNLLDNATNYSKIKPLIKLSLEETSSSYVINISDNGIGIAPEHQNKIFDKFFRVPKGNVHDVKGFGIGLSYVATMIKAFNWKIKLKSILNEGSTFSILIPKKQ